MPSPIPPAACHDAAAVVAARWDGDRILADDAWLGVRPFYNGGMKRRAARTFSYSVYYEQAPEGGYVAFVPALPGCHTQGETLEETERNVKEAIALYLESLAAHGEAIPEERRSFQGRVTVAA